MAEDTLLPEDLDISTTGLPQQGFISPEQLEISQREGRRRFFERTRGATTPPPEATPPPAVAATRSISPRTPPPDPTTPAPNVPLPRPAPTRTYPPAPTATAATSGTDPTTAPTAPTAGAATWAEWARRMGLIGTGPAEEARIAPGGSSVLSDALTGIPGASRTTRTLIGPQEELGPPNPLSATGVHRVPGHWGGPNKYGERVWVRGRNEPMIPFHEDPSTGNYTAGTIVRDPKTGAFYQWFGNPPGRGPGGRRRGLLSYLPSWLGGSEPAYSGWRKWDEAKQDWIAPGPNEGPNAPNQPRETGPTGKPLAPTESERREERRRREEEFRRRMPPFMRGGMGGPFGMGGIDPSSIFRALMGRGGGIPWGMFGPPGPYAGTSNLMESYGYGQGPGGYGYGGEGEGGEGPYMAGYGPEPENEQYIPTDPNADNTGSAPGATPGGSPAAPANPAAATPAAPPAGGAGATAPAAAPGASPAASAAAPAAAGGAAATPTIDRGWPWIIPPSSIPNIMGLASADGGTTNVAGAGLANAYGAAGTPGTPDGWGGYAPGDAQASAAAQTRNVTGPIGRNQTLNTVSTSLRQAGLPSSAVNAIWANILSESSGNPRSRHPDQPRYSGEAHYAHGLYQEGGDEWNRYSRWLQGRDWRDPALQTQFLAENIRARYPKLWNKLTDPNRSQEQKAVDFMNDYLRPARQYRVARTRQYMRGIRNYAPEEAASGT